jgi:hypothetical protein
MIRLSLKRGVSYGTISDIVKWVFVDVAKKEFQIPGKKISDSRISVITGLTRQEVKVLSAKESLEEFNVAEKKNRAVNIINGWKENKDFQDIYGEPAEIPFNGKEKSFEALVKEYGGDITPRPIFDELVRSESIEQLPGGKIRLKQVVFIPKVDEEQKISIMGSSVAALLQTIDHNIENPGKKDFLQLTSSALNLPKASTPYIRNEIKKKGIAFLQELDAWLVSQEVDPKQVDSEDVFEGGLGVFYYEENDRGTK